MGTKLMPGAFDCYGAALPDEPMFVLLARDASAPDMLRAWAERRRKEVLARAADMAIPADELMHNLRKCTEADQCADEMTVWRRRNEHAPWRESPSERRIARTETTAVAMAAVQEATIRAVGIMAGIPSQYHGGIEVLAHECRPWRSPAFNGVHHLIKVRAKDRFGDVIGKDLFPEVSDMAIGGQIVAEVDVVAGDADELTLTVLTVYDE